MRVCAICKQIKEEVEFSRETSKRCKLCWNNGTRLCSSCGKTSEETQFYGHTKCTCKECQKRDTKLYYHKHRDRLREQRRLRRHSQIKLIREYKETTPCADCGRLGHFAGMQFDHLPGSIKLKEVSNLTEYNLKVLMAEIDKCEVVCAYCHAVRTWERLETKVEFL